MAEQSLVQAEGLPVIASDGEELGKVEAVYEDRDTHLPEWLAVGSGRLGRKRQLVPVAGATVREAAVHVRFTAEQVHSTPEIEGDEVSQETERKLYSHYGLPYSEQRSDSGLPEQGHGGRRPSRGRASRGRRRSDGPTREELYAEAKKLGIEGRSKMNKRELARAVSSAGGRSQGRSGKANPVEVQSFLEGVGYPTRKSDLVAEARSQGASEGVRSTLERLPDKSFRTPTEVSEAIGRLG